MGVLGVGHGKLLLFGEHAAVYGHPAVGTSLPLVTEVAAATDVAGDVAEDGRTSARAKGVALQTALPAALHEVANLAARRAEGVLVVRSSLPHGVGLGSSAALCVALARAAGVSEVWANAHRLEHAFHGSPSGADTGLAAHTGGIAAFQWRPLAVGDDRPLPTLMPLAPADLHLVFGAVPRAASTAANVRRIAEARAAGDATVDAALEELGRVSAAAVDAFTPEASAAGGGGSLGRRLGELATDAHRVLTNVLGLGNDAQSRLLEAGREAGAAGGKLSGGGGGGAFVLFCDGEASAERVFEALRQVASPTTTLLGQLAVSTDDDGARGLPRILREVGVATSSATWRA